jgi:hypothetical protein
MGTSTIFDLIGSIIIAGTLGLMIMNTHAQMSQMNYTNSEDYIVQSNMRNLSRILEKDLRLIGYCANPNNFPTGSVAIVAGDTNKITFLADLYNNGTMDTVYYYCGTKAQASNTLNPNDFPIYRRIGAPVAANSYTDSMSVGCTQFQLQFFDNYNVQMATPLPGDSLSGVRFMQITIFLESPFAYDSSRYTYAYWRQMRLAGINLMNR